MKRFVIQIIIAVTFVFSAASCAAPAGPAVPTDALEVSTKLPQITTQLAPSERALTSGGSLAGVEIQRAGASSYEPLQAGQPVRMGDKLRSPDSAAAPLAELREEEGSLILLAPGARMRVELISPTIDMPQVRLRLEKGAVLVVAERPLGKGFLQVQTENGLAAIQGSAMTVSFYASQTTVACVQDSATLSGAQNTVVLPAGYISSVSPDSANQEPTAAEKFEANVAKNDPLRWEVISDRYYHFGFDL